MLKPWGYGLNTFNLVYEKKKHAKFDVSIKIYWVPKYLPIHQIPSLVFRNENMRGFYKGLAPNLLRVVPATAITFVTYEKVSHFIAELRQQ